MVEIRIARDTDVQEIADLYVACYGADYPFKQFYDTEWIKRGVYDREIRWYVGEKDGRLLGSAAIMLNAGDADDLVSEIGRLVVHPDARGLGLGTKLVEAVTGHADALSDYAFAECRTAHVGSQIIFERLGYHTVGIEPLVYKLGVHESVIFVCKLSENARVLRRGNPILIPEAFQLASYALSSCGFDVDAAVTPNPQPYIALRDFRDEMTLEPMSSRQVFRVLRLSRENFLNPEVFGSFRLEYGLLKMVQHKARYLVLKHGEAVLGGLGYTYDEVDDKVHIFELVASDPRAKGTLIERGIAYIEAEHEPRYMSADVNAHSARMQESLHLLGFAPVAYMPSMVYVMGERFDVVRMVKLRQEPKLRHWELLDSMTHVAEMAEQNLFDTARGVSIDDVTRRIRIFAGLTDAQVREVGKRCRELSYEPGETVFKQGADEQALFIVLEGKVDIVKEGAAEPLVSVGAGEIFGEMALLEELPRSAGAVTAERSRLLVMRPEDFDQLTRSTPEAAVIILRNMAHILSERLRSMDADDAIASGKMVLD